MATIIDKILAEVCLDERVTDGVFDMTNSAHMQALFETLTDNFAFKLEDARSIHNKMIEGKYPERQAYNKDGLLVTFPTPAHKAKAIQRGTHFEKDPSKGPTNIYGGGETSAQAQGQPPPSPGAGAPPADRGQNVFSTGGGTPTPETPAEEPAAPQGDQGGKSAPSQLPASETPAQAPQGPPAAAQAPAAPPAPPLPPSPLPIEPPPLPSGQQPPLPPPNFEPPKSPEIRSAESQAVKQMMNGDNNDPSLLPTMNEQMNRIERFCEKENLTDALKVIRRFRSDGFSRVL